MISATLICKRTAKEIVLEVAIATAMVELAIATVIAILAIVIVIISVTTINRTEKGGQHEGKPSLGYSFSVRNTNFVAFVLDCTISCTKPTKRNSRPFGCFIFGCNCLVYWHRFYLGLLFSKKSTGKPKKAARKP